MAFDHLLKSLALAAVLLWPRFAGGQPYPCEECCEPPIPPAVCECTCDLCLDTAPCCWKIVVSGVLAAEPEDCEDCLTLNGTYYARQDPENDCVWQCIRASTVLCEDSDDITLTLFLDGSDYKIKVELGDHTWVKNYGTNKPDCCEIVNDELTHDASGSDCDSSSASCFITRQTGTFCPCRHRCDCDDAPEEWTIDLGVGGWVDGLCERCDEIAGEWDTDEGFSFSSGVCRWRFLSRFDDPDPFCTHDSIDLVMRVSVGAAPYRYRLEIELAPNTLFGSDATYLSDQSSSSDCLDLAGEDGRIPLHKVSEAHGGSPQTCASGALPDPVYITPAA